MQTQIEQARQGVVTPQIASVALKEDLTSEYVRQMVAEGKIVIPWNHSRKPQVVGIGKGLSTKINASIGTSSDIIDYGAEVRKAL
ncbi:MAG: phosphomethylpyrimidine synthase ThiC, partial [Desulfuromonadales bacterium]